MEEQVDRYCRGLKSYIWKELCPKYYAILGGAMRDAERIESANRRVGDSKKSNPFSGAGAQTTKPSATNAPFPWILETLSSKSLPKKNKKCA